MADLMEAIRHMLGLKASEPPPMSDEQTRVAERLRRIKRRQESIDLQVEILRADRADARHH